MRAAVVVLVALLVSVVALSASGMRLRGLRDDSSWDYMILVDRYAPTVSLTANYPLPSNSTTFNLHGLWPNRNDGSYPSFCNKDYPFNYSEIAGMYNQLLAEWSNLQNTGTAVGFWTHEWEKHGTCAMNGQAPGITSEQSFFQGALQLRESLNAEQALQDAGIVASNDTPVSVDAVISALKSKTGYAPALCCTKFNDQLLLDSVEVCVDANMNWTECVGLVVDGSQQCSDPMYLPPRQ